jgi:hypothetical protein
MAKTFTTITAANATAGNAILASDHSAAFTTLNNHTVPPACHVYRSSNLTGYASGAAITWNAELYDTDGMFTASSTNITVSTAGIYLVNLKINWSATATVSAVGIRIAQNGSNVAQNYSTSVSGGISGSGGQVYVGSFAASDTISANITVAGGSAYIINGGASLTELVSSLSVTFLGLTA